VNVSEFTDNDTISPIRPVNRHISCWPFIITRPMLASRVVDNVIISNCFTTRCNNCRIFQLLDLGRLQK